VTAPLLVAHRGAPSRGATENTVRAFREAAAAGADGVEMDVRGTRDGRAVVFHDAEAALPGRRRAAVRSLSLEELRDPALEAHDRVASLEETLRALLARTGVIVEVKEPGIEERVCAVIASLKADRRLPWLLLASFHPGVLRRVKRSAPGVRRALVVSRRGPGLGGWIRGRWPLRAWRESGAEDLMPDHHLVTPALVEAVAARGGHVFAWTVNEPEEARRVVEAGAAGVVTDDLAGVGSSVRTGGEGG